MQTTATLDLGDPVVDGGPVSVRRLPLDADAGARAHALLLARRLVGIEHPHLARVVDVRADWCDLDLLSEVPEGTVPLAAVSSARELSGGEVIGVGLAVADALVVLHEAGLTHGRLREDDLLLRPDGSVVLTGYGIAGVLGSAGTPADDVADLLQLMRLWSGSGLVDPLGTVDTAADLLAALRSLPVLPEPVLLPGRRSAPAVHRPRRGRRPRWRWLRSLRLRLPELRPPGASPRFGWKALGAALPAAVGVLLLAGWLGASMPQAAGETPAVRPAPSAARPTAAPASASPSVAAPPAAPRQAPPAPDWRRVLTDLDDARAQLFAVPDEGRVATVDAPGSTAFAADLALVRDLKAHHAASAGLRTEVVSVQLRSAGATHVELSVVDVLHPYTIVATAPGSAVLQRRLGRPARTTAVTLVRGDAGWRVADVRPG